IDFNRTDLSLALAYLSTKAGELSGAGHPVDVVLIDPEATLGKAPVTLKMNQAPWRDALRYTCDLAGAEWGWDNRVAVVGAPGAVKRLALQRSKIQSGPGNDLNLKRLNSARIAKIEFKDTPLSDIAEYLSAVGQSREQNGGVGLPFNVIIKENSAKPVGNRRVTLTLHEASLFDVLHYVTGLADCRFRVDARAVVIGESADLAKTPGGPARPAGPLFDRMMAKQLESIEIPAGATISEFVQVMQTLGGINTLSLVPEAVASSNLRLQGVTAWELLRYFNEVSGTAFRLDPNALVIAPDPSVKVLPRPPADLAPPAVGVAPNGLKFDP
ncbi:MAG: hypothetical protein KDM64_17220, partial [Verrucomicrobiae bacterium]|nr:hypothetical protein [Verrucomicrobiae bacterium]